MVCYNSRIKMLHRMISSFYDSALKPYELTGNQFTLLLFIAKMKTTNQRKIADMLIINFSTVSRDLNKLHNADWVIITKDKDARNTNISLSAKGIALLATVLPVWEKANNEINSLFVTNSSESLNKMIESLNNKV